MFPLLILLFSTLAGTAMSDEELCIDLVRKLKIDRFSTSLDIDELIHAHHLYQYDSDVNIFNMHANWTFTIDLSCFENLRVISDAKERSAKHVILKKFTTQVIGSTSGYLRQEYSLRHLDSIRFTALILIKNDERIASLVLRHNQLAEISDGSLVLLRNLSYLSIASNLDSSSDLNFNLTLTLSKDSFYELGQLTHLDLSMNPPIIGNLSCLCKLTELVHLDLAFTYAPQMYAFPYRCFEKLKFLNMTRKGTGTQSVDFGSFEKWPALEVLDLSGVKLQSQFFFKGFFKNPNLKELKLESDFDLTGYLRYLNKLERLDISRQTTLNIWGFRDLINTVFKGLENLKQLTIKSYLLEESNIENEVFKDTPHLTYLDLSFNTLTTRV